MRACLPAPERQGCYSWNVPCKGRGGANAPLLLGRTGLRSLCSNHYSLSTNISSWPFRANVLSAGSRRRLTKHHIGWSKTEEKVRLSEEDLRALHALRK